MNWSAPTNADVSLLIAQPETSSSESSPINRLRGVMVSPSSLSREDIRHFVMDWNGNVIRVPLYMKEGVDDPLNANYVNTSDLNYVNKVWSEAFAQLDRILDISEDNNLRVIVDMHTVPYKRLNEGFWDNSIHFDLLITTWQVLAARLLDRGDVILGYDLLNEPGYGSTLEWQMLAQRIADAIREIDPNRTLIMECAIGANPIGFKNLVPLNNDNVIYSVHMYLPHAFTHQNLHEDSLKHPEYPGTIFTQSYEFTPNEQIFWDKNILKESLQPVLDFQNTYNVPILVGEFSAVRWAPGAYDYIRDAIEIFEEYGWDWIYHAYREWSGWSVEHTPDRSYNQPAEPTYRELLLREWFRQNNSAPIQIQPPLNLIIEIK